MITICPRCDRQHDKIMDSERARCPRCGYWHLPDAAAADEDPDPDYGGAFDGRTVISDADPGL